MSQLPLLVRRARVVLRQELAEHYPTGPIVVAVSGGSDSMALAVTAGFVAKKLGRELRAICVDHGIRAESGSEAEFVTEQLGARGISVITRVVTLAAGGGPEDSARQARYAALADFARDVGAPGGPAVVLLGHTQNDQAETVLLGFGRGSGAKSIAGMPAVGGLPGNDDVPMLRPFLAFSRQDLRTMCQEMDVPWVDDPSNELDSPWRCADGSQLHRTAVRHRVIPELTEILGSGTVGAIARTAQLLQVDNEALEYYATKEFARVVRSTSPITLDCLELATVPTAIRRRVLKYAMEESGVRRGELVYWHIAELDKLVVVKKNNCGLDLPGVRVRREQNVMMFEPGKQSQYGGSQTTPSTPVIRTPMEDK